ncbi:MAG: hypothetical protein KH452_12185 [Clostridiales bacterium]|nr:hypothetical protein [Clostridiales bacterium]
MKRRIIQCVTILLAFLAGVGFMNYATYMGNRDMTAAMAEATLPVVYAEKDGQIYNEMHGYVTEMDGSYMMDSILGLSEDHRLGIAVEKYNAQIENISYEVRSLDMSRLIESGENLPAEDDGKYLHLTLDLKDLLERGEKYLFLLKVQTEEHGPVFYYSQISYLGQNHVQECVDFAKEFHDMTVQKDTEHAYLNKLEPDGTMDGRSLGYVNIHSRSGPVAWGDMPVEQISEELLRFTELEGDIVSLVMEYDLRNTQTGEVYEVTDSFRIRYSVSNMYLLAYERTADRIFSVDGQLVQDGKIPFGIQSGDINYRKNEDESVVGFVQQGQLWCYDFGQNRLSRVYGFEDGEDARGFYNAHDFRILTVEDSGSMDFLVYGYMNRGNYEGRSGVLLCHYDALMNTVEEQYFLPSDRPYQVVREEIGELAVENETGKAWLSYRDMILQINLADCSVKILAEGVSEKNLQVSESGRLAAWTDENGENISLLNTGNGTIGQIPAESTEALQVLGFMEEDFLYGTAYREDIRTDMAGQQIVPMYKVTIRGTSGNEVREFDYASKGKYVTGVSIVENRIDLSCITLTGDGSYAEALPEPITYTSEPVQEKLSLETASDEVKRNEYHFAYEGKIKKSSMKRPKVKLVLFEGERILQLENQGTESYYAWSFQGTAKGFDTLPEAVVYAYEGMGSVWKNGYQCYWERGNRLVRTQITGFEDLETMEMSGSGIAQCVQLLLRQKQIYMDVQAELDAGTEVWELLERELGESVCLIPGCSLNMALYYVSQGMPVIAVANTGSPVLIVGYDPLNITYYEPGQTALRKAGIKDSTAMFEAAGNQFFTCLPE